MISRRSRQILVALCLLILGSGVAQALTVQELGVTPAQVVNITTRIYAPDNTYTMWTGNVLAGINQLAVDGHPMNGFCVDPFHFSVSSSTGYSFVALTGAPKSPIQLTMLQVTWIERLWGSYYNAALGSASIAAGLQIAIWDIVGEAFGFHVNGGNDYGAAGFLAVVKALNYSGPQTHLIALTGPGQDYIVEAVPDAGATVGMLGLAFMTVFIARWWSMRRQAPALGRLFASGGDSKG